MLSTKDQFLNNNFKLLDLIGSNKIQDYNEKHNLLVYTSDYIITILNLNDLSKKHIIYHDSPIACLKFSLCCDFLFSLDKTISSSVVVWEIPSFKVLYQSFLPIPSALEQNLNNNINKFLRNNNNEDISNYNHNKGYNNDYDNSVIISDIYLDFFSSNQQSRFCFVIVINYSNNQQSFLIMQYSIIKNVLDLVLETTPETNSLCKGIITFKKYWKEPSLFNSNNNYNSLSNFNNENSHNDLFITIDDKIKIWKAEDSSIKLLIKIQTKEEILTNSLVICETLKLISIISEGNSVILDYKGNFLISLSCEYVNNNYTSSKEVFGIEKFVYQTIKDEKLFVGTDKGSLLVYSLNGFKLLFSSKYNYSEKQRFCLNYDNRYYDELISKDILNKANMTNNKNIGSNNNVILNNSNISVSGPNISYCTININLDLVVIKYDDNSLIVDNLSKILSNTKIISNPVNMQYNKYSFSNTYLDNYTNNSNNYSSNAALYLFSHMEKTSSILWLNNNFTITNKTNSLYSNTSLYNNISNVISTNKSFITTSTDQTIMLWTYKGDRWENKYFDILKSVDISLNYYKDYYNSNSTKYINQINKNIFNVNNNTNILYSNTINGNAFNSIINNYTDNHNKDVFSNLVNEKSSIISNFSTKQNSKHYITTVISHTKLSNLLIAGDNKGNIITLDIDEKTPSISIIKKTPLVKFSIDFLSFNHNSSYLLVGCESGMMFLCEYASESKICCIISEAYMSGIYKTPGTNTKMNRSNYDKNIRNYNSNTNTNTNNSPLFAAFLESSSSSKANNTKTDYLNYISQPHNYPRNTNPYSTTIEVINSITATNFNSIKNTKNTYISNNTDLFALETNPLRVLALKDIKTISIQTITKSKGKYINTIMKEIVFKTNICKAVLHQSSNYIITLLVNSIIVISRVETGNVCGEININGFGLNSSLYDFIIDPSGLYLAAVVDNFEGAINEDLHVNGEYNYANHNKDIHEGGNRNNVKVTNDINIIGNNSGIHSDNMTNKVTNNLDHRSKYNSLNEHRKAMSSIKNESDYNKTFTRNINTLSNRISSINKDRLMLRSSTYNKFPKSSILFFELGTGKLTTTLKNVFNISNFSFSPEGQYLAVTSSQGAVSIWQTSNEIRENIMSVLAERKKNALFWDMFSISYINNNDDNNNLNYNINNEKGFYKYKNKVDKNFEECYNK